MEIKKWSDLEIEFLKTHYSIKGCKFICDSLNRNRGSVAKKTRQLGLKIDKDLIPNNLSEVKNIILTSKSFSEVLQKLGKTVSGSQYKVLKRYIKKYDIDISHFDPHANKPALKKHSNVLELLVVGSNISSFSLKNKLYNANLKSRFCELCGQGEIWNGNKMSLILDHINGIANDNQIENLRIVCPNCNATLPTHCRGYKGLK